MSKQPSSTDNVTESGLVVDGHHVAGKKPKGLKKLTQKKYGKHTLVAIIFALVGVAGLFYASAATTTTSLWTNNSIPKNLSDSDTKSVELGVKFKSSKAGKVTGVKFYKSAQNTGTHTGTLWDSTGNQLATVTFSNETASGWQTANFPQAVNIASGTTYVISYHAPRGHYSGDNNYFAKTYANGILSAPAGSNGIYSYSNNTTFPRNTYKASNYWVDVIVQTDLIGSTAAPAPPTVVTAAQVGNTIVVNWNEGSSSNGITKYRIYKNNNYLMAVGTNPRTFVDTNIQAGKTYTYQIKTVDANGTGSVRSVAASATYNLSPPPPTTCPEGQTGTPPNCVTPPPPPVSTTGPANCLLTQADEPCWAANTGVLNETTAATGDRWTQAQIRSGAADAQLQRLTGCQVISQGGTDAAHPYVYRNKRINGALAIRANYVRVENVYVEQADVGWCQGGMPGNTSGCCSAIMTGNDNGTSLIHDVAIVDSEVEAGANSLGSGLVGDGMNIQRVNAHGGFIILGYNSRSYIQDSYIHDVTREDECVYQLTQNGQSCVSATGVTRVKGTPEGYLHKDTLWEQGIHDLAIVHSYMKHSSWTNPIGGSSGGCLCDNNTRNIYISNSLLYGGSGTGIIAIDSGGNFNPTKMVWDRVRLGGSSPFLGSPAQMTDYSSGAWTPSWDTTSPGPGYPGIPKIDRSRCNGIMNLSGGPISCG